MRSGTEVGERLLATRLAGVVLTLAAVGGCTSSAPDPADGRTERAMPEPQAEPDPGTRADPPPEPPPRHAPRAREPLAFVTHVTSPRLRLTRAEAADLLREDSPRSALLAQGLPGGPRVEQAPSPAAVKRAVRQDPDLVGVVPASAVDPTVRVALVGGVDPLGRPRHYRPTIPAPRAAGRPGPPVTLTVVGDIMLARGVTDPAGALAPLSPRLRSADLTVGNLESTLSRAGPPTQGGDSFGADPGVVEPLRRAGFDALSLANNHAGDFGEEAMLATVRRLRAAGLRPFGAGEDLRAAGEPVVVTRNGVRFGLIGFNAIGETPRATPGTAGALSVRMPPRTGPLQESDLRQVTRRVGALEDRVDVVVVLPHWGTQYTHAPEPVQRVVGRRLVDAGADLVVGGHPHWVQGLDRVGDAVVAHSLGNFVFDMDFMTQTLQGVVLEATFRGDRLAAVELLPYRMGPAFAPRPASPVEAREILADVWSTSTGPFGLRR